ncbi:P-loop containing nucleoside triphosphate hydrolase protein [Lyophyllum atratum]|nr:P-loop containing nucleoside triphosphate hydrolase protein [Lyophyllum atratum]
MPPRYRRPRTEESRSMATAALASDTANFTTVGTSVAATPPRPAKKLKTNPAPAPVNPPVATPTMRPASPSASRHFSDRKFQDANLSAQSKAGIEHEFMSDVQAATLDLGLSGKDLLVQAKTGTGKTIAFLLPAIERLLKARTPLQGISVLVLAPTRELALQIEEEAKLLLKHHKNFTVGHVIGGTKANQSLNTLLKKPPTILIATPGRLHDNISTPEVAAQFRGLQALVYDEADRLLDQGFRRELSGILAALPNRKVAPRQVMLFSATISKEIKEVAKEALSADHAFVSTLLEDEVNTHEHVPQTHIVTRFANTLPLALHILRQERLTHALPSVTPQALSLSKPTLSNLPASQPAAASAALSTSKTIVFFPTARHVSLAYELLASLPGLPPVYELHSRKSQEARSKASARFKDAQEAVLVSSDVAARGMDFPGYAALSLINHYNEPLLIAPFARSVTLVVQLGLPASSEQYIHRLGRTARAGQGGRGIIVLDPAEARFLEQKDVRPFGITPDPQFTAAASTPSTTPDPLASERTEVAQALSRTLPAGRGVDEDTKAQAYRAWLGYYNSHTKLLRWDKAGLVRVGGAYVREALGWGVGGEGGLLPEMETKLIGKMGLKGVEGMNVVKTKMVERGGAGGPGRGRAPGGGQPAGRGRGSGGPGRR